MRFEDPAPRRLRSASSLVLFAATACALANLPARDLPLPWLLAFTLPGAVLGAWSRLALAPWWRATFAVVLQALACWGALELSGPMTRPAALACTILPPLAFATTRNHDLDPSLALFLGFCVTLVGVILDGVHLPLLLGYGAAAFLSLHLSTLLVGHRTSSARRVAPPRPTRAADVLASSSLMLSCLVAALAVDRTLSCVPSPSQRSGDAGTSAPAEGPREIGLDDSFVLDGQGGILSQLTGEQLVRAMRSDGANVPADMYLRCGFFTVPGMDRWSIGRLSLQAPSRRDGHTLRKPLPRVPVHELELERFAGATKFVFLPPNTVDVDGLYGLTVDPDREWIRPTEPREELYVARYQDLPAPAVEPSPDPRAREQGLLTLPRDLDEPRFQSLMQRWNVGREPLRAMAAIADGLARHCRYDRNEPTGPFAHAIENFLFAEGDRRGYCMHFASAAALMLRLRGIPCRIGVGLYGGKPDDREPTARLFGSQNAHAWVEVPLAGRGWFVFDPTPPDLRGRSFVPDQGPQQASDPTVEVEHDLVEPVVRAVRETLQQPWTWAVALAAALLFAVLPRRQPAPPGPPLPPVAKKVRRALQRLLRALARAGHRRARGQTLEQFARELARLDRLPPEVADAFVAYQEVRFGDRPFDEHRAARMAAGRRAAESMVEQDEPSAALAAQP